MNIGESFNERQARISTLDAVIGKLGKGPVREAP
jgi:hypothetical protein